VHIRRTEIPSLVKAYGLGIDGQLRGRGADVRDPALDVARMPSGGRCRGPPTTQAIRTAHRMKFAQIVVTACCWRGAHRT
jgi:hypothetical protein